ncbi:ankyrin repeat and LEM domain-containing protein 1 isoform X1 [Amblyraja radiata]|uniref:ankyrin repeat and LEM domain-containing protein 1 isoform X1 n=1 Tax=Amblyraja radiata TaxID=386614 RepID=UPI001403C331|nr:ankyrin repeat and LEM domain-containing protein 1 isoform X1 [Amblyraja radiata]
MSGDRAVRFLHRALRHHDARSLEKWLKREDPNLVLPDGTAVLHLACGQDTEAALWCVKLLLQQGADPNVRSSEDLTPLHVAASWGCIKCVKLLLKNGADPTLVDQDGQSAVDLAREHGHVRCCQLLLQYRDYTVLEDSWENGPVLQYVGFWRVSSGLHSFAVGAQSRVTDAHRTTGLPRVREESPTARGTRHSLAGSEWEVVPSSPGRGQGARSSSVGDPLGEVTSVWARGVSAAAESQSLCNPADIPAGGDEDRCVGEASEPLPESCVLSSTRLSNAGRCVEQTLNGLDSTADRAGDPTPSNHDLAASPQLPLALSPGPDTSTDDESFLPPSAAGAPHPVCQGSHTSISPQSAINGSDTTICPHHDTQPLPDKCFGDQCSPPVQRADQSSCVEWLSELDCTCAPSVRSQASQLPWNPRRMGLSDSEHRARSPRGDGTDGTSPDYTRGRFLLDQDKANEAGLGCANAPDNDNSSLGLQEGAGYSGSSDLTYCSCDSGCEVFASAMVSFSYRPQPDQEHPAMPPDPGCPSAPAAHCDASVLRCPRRTVSDWPHTQPGRETPQDCMDSEQIPRFGEGGAIGERSGDIPWTEGLTQPVCGLRPPAWPGIAGLLPGAQSDHGRSSQAGGPALNHGGPCRDRSMSVGELPLTLDGEGGWDSVMAAKSTEDQGPKQEDGSVAGQVEDQACPRSSIHPNRSSPGEGAGGDPGSERRSKEVRSLEGGSSLGDEGRLSPFVTLRSKRRLANRGRQTPEFSLFDQSVPMATRTRRIRTRPERGGGGLSGYSSPQRDTSWTGGDGERSPPLTRSSSGEDADFDTVPFLRGEGAARGRGSASFDTVPFVWGRGEGLAGPAQGQKAELSRNTRSTSAVGGPSGAMDWGGGLADPVQGQRAELGQGGGVSGFVQGQSEGSEMSRDAGWTGPVRRYGQGEGLGRDEELAALGQGVGLGRGSGVAGSAQGQIQGVESYQFVASTGSATVPPGEVGPVERGFGALPPSYTESAGGNGRAGTPVLSNPGKPDGCLRVPAFPRPLGDPTQGGSKASGSGPKGFETQSEGGTEGYRPRSCSPSPRPLASRVLSGGLEWQRPQGPPRQPPVPVSLSGDVSEAVEYLYTDTEGSHGLIECCYPSGEPSLCHPDTLEPSLCHPSTPETSQSRHPASDSETTLVYDWRSYRSSRGGPGGKENVQPSDLLPSQTSPNDRHPRRTSPSGVCSSDPSPGSPCQSDPCPNGVSRSQSSPSAQPPSNTKPSGPRPALAEVSPRLLLLSNSQILQQLRECGHDPGPVTDHTRTVYLLRLHRARREPRRLPAPGYSPELARSLDKYQFPDCSQDEMALVQQFDQPDPSRKWREGLVKSSFNYLLLDPRVTRNLPIRCHSLGSAECFRTFVSAIFYVGKGKRARPYCHLYEALTHFKHDSRKMNSRLQHIVEIWGSGCGVISLHCFQGVIPAEAYTREACMVDALGLEMLTNRKRGNYYGVATTWSQRRRRQLGVLMLRRAMDIFLAEGERQLRPADV